jgi:hypothetical protein
MLRTNGRIFEETLAAIKPDLTTAEKQETIEKISKIAGTILKTFNEKIGTGIVGSDGHGIPQNFRITSMPPAGLVYGRIQSGKTRAMITSSAMAFDNGFKIVIVITSNINRLVDQTQKDFRNGLPPGIAVHSPNTLGNFVESAKLLLNQGSGGIVIVCSKGSTRLQQVIDFLSAINAKNYPALVFDDEGDQATLDTNNLRRSQREPDAPASRIHTLVHDDEIVSLRNVILPHIFVSVTGTPQGLVLQSADNSSRPAFIELLEPGNGYVGGDVFFQSEPSNNKLISLIDEDEKITLLSDNASIPEGLKSAIRYFFLAAAAAVIKIGWPSDNEGYKFLCHPSVKTAEQEKVNLSIISYINQIIGSLNTEQSPTYNDLQNSYSELSTSSENIPPFIELLSTIKDNINSFQILLVNKNTTNESLNYSRCFNLLIGGNTLGRGIAIKNLLVTYYVRESKITQMDTMYQHARMFGYRRKTLPFTKVFLPPQLYSKFQQIWQSDEELRKYIANLGNNPAMLPVRIASNIRATRKAVLDVNKIEILTPGRQIYPNYPYFESPKAEQLREKALAYLQQIFPNFRNPESGRTGIRVSTETATRLAKMIRTNGSNIWVDKKIPEILADLRTQAGNEVIIKFRHANRNPSGNGLLASGVLAGDVVTEDAAIGKPVLWIFDMEPTDDWNNTRFLYPTIVLPQNILLTIFNKS